MSKKIILNDINIEPFLKAQARLKEYTSNMKTDMQKTAAVKAFEYCYELSWKILKKILLKHEGAPEPKFSKDIFRQAAVAKLIDDPETWFSFIKMRNQTVHSYNEETLDHLASLLPLFQKELDSLIERIQNLS